MTRICAQGANFLIRGADPACHGRLRYFRGRSDRGSPRVEVDRLSGHLSYSGSDDPGVRRSQPLGWLLNSLRLVCARFEIAVVLAPFLIVGYVIALPYDQKRGRTRLFNDHDVIGRLPQHLGCARHRGLCPVDAGPSPGFKRRGRGHRLLGCTSFMGPSLLPRPAMEMFLFGVAYLVVLFDHKEYITRT